MKRLTRTNVSPAQSLAQSLTPRAQFDPKFDPGWKKLKQLTMSTCLEYYDTVLSATYTDENNDYWFMHLISGFQATGHWTYVLVKLENEAHAERIITEYDQSGLFEDIKSLKTHKGGYELTSSRKTLKEEWTEQPSRVIRSGDTSFLN